MQSGVGSMHAVGMEILSRTVMSRRFLSTHSWTVSASEPTLATVLMMNLLLRGIPEPSSEWISCTRETVPSNPRYAQD